MADHPHDAPTSRRRSAVLPPFVAPRGSEDARRTPPPNDGAKRWPYSTPTRLFTPPGAMPRHAPLEIVAPSAATGDRPDAQDNVADPVAADVAASPVDGQVGTQAEALATTPLAEPVVADHAGEGSGGEGLVLDDGADASDDWFEVVDEEREAPVVAPEMAALAPTLFNGLNGLDRMGPTAAREATSMEPETSEPESAPCPEPEDPRAMAADALERVAIRIRDGQIALPADIPASTEEAALAAVLAALLRSPSR